MYNSSKPYTAKILELIKQTWEHPFYEVNDEGAYPVLRIKETNVYEKFPYQIDHTDGIGTKGYYHWQAKTWAEAVQDAMAMNLNDLAMAGAIATKMQSHIVLPTENDEIVGAIVENLVKECKKREIIYTGGETSIQWNMSGMDLSITMSGLVKELRPNQCQLGDYVLALPSNGLHSNGFTLVHQLFKEEMLEEFTTPTAIYYDAIRNLPSLEKVSAMMHITGGGLGKLHRILPNDLDLYIDGGFMLSLVPPPAIYHLIKERGRLDNETMYSNFNCGIGFVICGPEKVIKSLDGLFGGSSIVGRIEKGSGEITVLSAFPPYDGRVFVIE